MDWDKLRVFHAVGEAGSFTHAGEALNLSQSAVSRQISALEESLGVPLFHRHARGLILTEQGELLYQTTRDVFTRLAAVQSMLSETTEKPTGPLAGTDLSIGDSWGVAAHAGFDMALSPQWLITADVRWIDIDSTVRVNGAGVGTVHVDPWAFGISAGYRF